MPDLHTLRQSVAEANAVTTLLDEAGWTDVICPRLVRLRDQYRTLVSKATLGETITLNKKEVSAVQIAARAEAIDWLIKTFATILRRGEEAVAALDRELNQ